MDFVGKLIIATILAIFLGCSVFAYRDYVYQKRLLKECMEDNYKEYECVYRLR